MSMCLCVSGGWGGYGIVIRSSRTLLEWQLGDR